MVASSMDAMDVSPERKWMPAEARWVPLALGAVWLIWGSTYYAIRVAVEGLPPLTMAGTRFLLSGVSLLVFLRLRGAPWPTWREWGWAVPVGALMFAVANGAVTVAERSLPSGLAAVMSGTVPLMVAALGRLSGERTSAREWLALAVGFAGVLLLGLGGEMRAEPFAALLLVVSPLSWASGTLLARRLPLAKGLMSAATQMLAGGALLTLGGAALGEGLTATPPLAAVLAWAYLTLFGSLVGYSAYTYLLRHTRPALATSHSYVNPAVAVVLGAVLGGEVVRAETAVAVALIVAATVGLMLARRPARLTASR